MRANTRETMHIARATTPVAKTPSRPARGSTTTRLGLTLTTSSAIARLGTTQTRHWWAILRDQGAAPREPKTHLQEWTQGRGLNLPEYTVTDRAGPAHAPTFTVELRVTGQAPVTASGPNKRAAETKAAAAMLAALGIVP